jgi:hypothetical protein
MTNTPPDEATTLDRSTSRLSNEATTDPGVAPPAQAPPCPPRATTPVDKNDRPAGRRFLVFTPPAVGVAPREEPTERMDVDSPIPPPTPPWFVAGLAAMVRRRNVLITLALSAAAGLVVASQLKLYAIERDRARLPTPSSASVATASTTPSHGAALTTIAPPRASTPVASGDPVAVMTSTAPRHVPAPGAPDASPPTSSTAAPTRAPIAPAEPPF